MKSGSRSLRGALAALALSLAAAAPAAADTAVTADLIERLLQALAAEESETEKVAPQLAEVDAKIRKFEECKAAFEAAGEASGQKLGGLAAKIAIKAKCGASSADGFHEEKQKIMEGPEKAALAILKIKSKDYLQLKDRVSGYLGGNRGGFKDAELAELDRRREELASALRVSLGGVGMDGGAMGAGGGGRRRGHDFSSANYAWEYIGTMFQVMYLSGAMMFEKPYQPGEWTRWQLAQESEAGEGEEAHTETSQFERAFLFRTDDGGEWWRTVQIDLYEEEGKQSADTVVLEGLFKGENEYVRRLVRMRGRFPGRSEPEELMVPQHLAMLPLNAAMPFAPTKESVEGATVGTDKVAGFDARHVRFGGGEGSLEWWISDTAPGGWVRFRHTDAASPEVKRPGSYTMEMTGHGAGAVSLLGVK